MTQPINHHEDAPRVRVDKDGITIDRKLAIPGALVSIVVVMALTLMGERVLPFYTRSEAQDYRELVEQEIAGQGLRLTTDEAAITKLQGNYTDIQTNLAEINATLARIDQRLDDTDKAQAAAAAAKERQDATDPPTSIMRHHR